MESIAFPKGFIWGAASSAYQIEGSPLADGAGPTNWHVFSHKKGTIKDGTNGDVACDHYHRYKDDIREMKALGVTAYRFSVGWGRIFPEPGRVNPRGIDFYSRLVDSLLEAGIDPWITIFHLEEPLWLAQRGGFARRSSVDHLTDLGKAVFTALGDRVRNWITINEPTIYSYSGYALGEFPPGKKFDLKGMLNSIHNLLLAHARLCDLWAASGRGGRIGIAHHGLWVEPVNAERPRDREAAAFMDDMANGAVLDPILLGRYPERAVKRMGRLLPRSFEKDLDAMKRPGTYVGINYYTRNLYRWSRFMPYLHASEYVDPRSKRSAMWEIYPKGLYGLLLRLKDAYGNPPCVITENGFPLVEQPHRDPLDDAERINYLREHVAMVGAAIAQGVDCKGFFHWSLLDNFEWNWGLSMRFGLILTDFVTQERTWKKSAFWYRDLARANALHA
jgi:beta-glucosidase